MINNVGFNTDTPEEDGLDVVRSYSINVFGQTGQEIGEWLNCTNLREEPDRVAFTDDRGHEVVLRGGIVVLQEQ